MEPEEFKEFFLRVYPQLVRYVRQVHDPSSAEDLASKALEDLWAMSEPAPADDHAFFRLRKFTFSILRRNIGHHIREEGARRRRELAFTAERELQAAESDITDEVAKSEWPGWTNGLREEERQLLGLHANGYKPAEIAPILGIHPSAVSARLQRAKTKARKLWEKEARRGETERP